jgi:hypothetical protein
MNYFMTTALTEFTNGRLIITGNILTYQIFQKAFRIGPRPLRKKKVSRSDKPYTRVHNLHAARRRLIDWVNTNAYAHKDYEGRILHPTFLTMTHAENITDVKYSNYEFLKFVQRVNYHQTGQKKSWLKYVATVEFQKRGAVHYHAILFNLPFVEKAVLAKLWGHGFIDIRDISRVKNLGFYMTKYMVKNADDQRLSGHLSYLVSRGLNKPKVFYNLDIVNQLIKDFPIEAQERMRTDVDVPYLGKMDSLHFNLVKHPEVRKQVDEFIARYGLN